PAAKPDWVDRTWQRVAEEVAAGRQAYVVCPRIGDEDGDGRHDLEEGLDLVAEEGVVDDEQDDGERVADGGGQERPLAGVVGTIEILREHPALRELRLEMLHGRMPPEDKDAVMARYTAGEIDVLVST